MAEAIPAIKLSCWKGHWEMREPQLRRLGEASWAMVVPCDFGHHFLRPSASVPGVFEFGLEPYGFSDSHDAWDAAFAYARAFEQQHRAIR